MSESLLHNSEKRAAELHSTLQYLLEPLETSRIDIKKRLRIFLIVLLCIILIQAGLIIFFQKEFMFWILAAIIILSIIIYFVWINSPKSSLTGRFHKEIVPHIVAEFISESSFLADDFISTQEYFNSGLFHRGVDRYNGSSLTSGKLGNTSIKFSKLHTEYKTQTRTKNGGTKTTWHTIFKGIFLIADSNKNFQSTTYIFPDTAERALGGIGKWFQEKFGGSGRGEMVYMEDPVFEKKFVVYASDPVEARYLLTPSMQEYFIDLSKHLGSDSIHASFINGKLFLALSGNFDLFNFDINKSLKNPDTIKYYTRNLINILSVIEILDLNTRIWGK